MLSPPYATHAYDLWHFSEAACLTVAIQGIQFIQDSVQTHVSAFLDSGGGCST